MIYAIYIRICILKISVKLLIRHFVFHFINSLIFPCDRRFLVHLWLSWFPRRTKTNNFPIKALIGDNLGSVFSSCYVILFDQQMLLTFGLLQTYSSVGMASFEHKYQSICYVQQSINWAIAALLISTLVRFIAPLKIINHKGHKIRSSTPSN